MLPFLVDFSLDILQRYIQILRDELPHRAHHRKADHNLSHNYNKESNASTPGIEMLNPSPA